MFLTHLPECKLGDTLSLDFEYTDEETNLPLNLTGCTFRLSIKNSRTNELAVMATTSNGLLQLEPELGKIKLELIVNFSAGNYVYDIEMTMPNGEVISSDTCYLEIVQDVTD